jgi:hypothetical protein
MTVIKVMEGYLTGDVSTALKAVGAERPGDQYRQPSANFGKCSQVVLTPVWKTGERLSAFGVQFLHFPPMED